MAIHYSLRIKFKLLPCPDKTLHKSVSISLSTYTSRICFSSCSSHLLFFMHTKLIFILEILYFLFPLPQIFVRLVSILWILVWISSSQRPSVFINSKNCYRLTSHLLLKILCIPLIISTFPTYSWIFLKKLLLLLSSSPKLIIVPGTWYLFRKYMSNEFKVIWRVHWCWSDVVIEWSVRLSFRQRGKSGWKQKGERRLACERSWANPVGHLE